MNNNDIQRVQPSPDEAHHESEMIIAYFRVLLVVAAVVAAKIAPGIIFSSLRDATEGAILIFCATAYNIFTAVSYWKRWRIRYQRHLMLLMDMVLISWWIQISGPDRSSLFPLYYVVVVVAAIWFKVFGAVVVAAICSALYVALQWSSEDVASTIIVPDLIAPLPALFLLAVLGGVVSENHDRERNRTNVLQQRVNAYEREIDLSREIRNLLRPHSLPRTHLLQIGAADRTSRGIGGGDYYDAFELDEWRMAICVADVAGKSLRAQSRLPLLKYALHAVAPEHDSPARVVERLNDILFDDLQPDLFITLLYATINPQTRRIEVCNAGHPAPIRFGTNGAQPAPVRIWGPALGLVRGIRYETYEMDMAEDGGGFVVYTDGVVNATHRDIGEFGEDRLARLIANHRDSDAQSIADLLVRSVDEFEESRRTDDATVMVVKVNETGRKEGREELSQ